MTLRNHAPAHVSPDQRVADVNDLTLGNFRRRACLDPLLEDPLDDAAPPPLSNPGQARTIRQSLVQAVAE
jgi:hypothetical protein